MKVILIIIFRLQFMMLGLCVQLQPIYSQIDTLKLKMEIASLRDQYSIQAYLTNILEKDQSIRGSNTSVESDAQRLIAISYFFNQFGYPSNAEFGESANAPRLIWIHNKFLELRRITFPLILNAYRTGQVDENLVRSYYLRRLYEDRWDDDGIKNYDLSVLFDTLELNTTNHISIKEIVAALNEIRSFNSLLKKEVTVWNASERSKWITENGERKYISYKTSPVQIFVLENCRIYFQKIHSDNSYEPRELIRIGEHMYKFKDIQTDKYFEVDQQGNLVYRNDAEVFDMYPKKAQ